jgi:hypothetical protein
VDSTLGLTPVSGDILFTYDPVNGYSIFDASSGNPSGWAGGVKPSVNVGQGFFYFSASANPNLWVRTFNVN